MQHGVGMRGLAGTFAVTVLVGTAWSGQYAFVGARALGMGGANAVTVRDATAQQHNPAVLGFMHQSQEQEQTAETNLLESAETNTAPTAVVDTNVVDVAAVETNLVNIAPETSAVPPSVTNTNVVEDATVETNAAGEAVVNTGSVIQIEGAFGPIETESEATDEESFNLLDNNGLSDRTFGWNMFDVGLGYSMTENMGRYLDILSDVDFNTIDQVDTPQQVSDLVALAAALQGVSEPGNSFYIDANAGTSMRIGHFAFGIRLLGESALRVDELDSLNLGLDVVDTTDLDLQLSGPGGVAASDTDYQNLGGYSAVNFSTTQQSDLTGAGLSQASVDYLDYQMGLLLADGTLSQSDIDEASSLLTDIVAASGGGALADNRTTVTARGFALAEVPISYGRAINENLSLGITAKAMFGRVLGTRVWVFDDDNLDEAVQSVSDTESDTLTFGLDLGAMYRISNFQFAAVGHNLNRPSFDGYTDSVMVNGSPERIVVPDVKMDPQVTVGAAFIPSERFLIEVNYDLLETGTLLEGYDIQRLSAGAELDIWALVLRIGAYNNVAESEKDWVLTAGIGANVFGVRADLGGAYSLDTAEYDGNEIPAEARVGLSLSLDY